MKDELKKEMLLSVKKEADLILEDEDSSEHLTLSFIQDNRKADDVLYWHRMAENELDEIEKFKRDEIERITRFSDSKKKGIYKRIEFYKAVLDSYHLTTNGKALSLTNGTINRRKTPDRVVVENEDKFFIWWQENGKFDEIVKTTYKPKLKDLKKYVEESGECPEGCEYITGTKKFYIKTYE